MELDSIIEIMGGEKTLGVKIGSPMDFVTYFRNGVPVAVLLSIQKRTGFTIKEIGKVLHVSESTLQRRFKIDQRVTKIKGATRPFKSKGLSSLKQDEAEKAFHLSQVFAKGEEVFGNTEKFKKWLFEENLVLGNQKPIEFLYSSIGTQQVLELLFGIEHGHFF